MKPNPKNFKPFVDPDGGEWIEITGASKYKGVIWRPTNMEMGDTLDDGSADFKYEIEELTLEGQSSVAEDKQFQELCSAMILDILQETIDNAKV